MADNFKPEIFPHKIKKEFGTLSLITDIFYEILSLFYIPYLLYRFKTMKTAGAPYMKDKRTLGNINHTLKII
jgi:hypothetical protein